MSESEESQNKKGQALYVKSKFQIQSLRGQLLTQKKSLFQKLYGDQYGYSKINGKEVSCFDQIQTESKEDILLIQGLLALKYSKR